jgi:hypothetical protein
MHIMRILAATTLILLSLSANAEDGFQGLGSSSSMQDVARRFPNATKIICPESLKETLLSKGVACEYMELNNYTIEKLPLTGRFLFSSDTGKLKSISLTGGWGKFGTIPSPVEFSKFRQLLIRFESLMTEKYGKAAMACPWLPTNPDSIYFNCSWEKKWAFIHLSGDSSSPDNETLKSAEVKISYEMRDLSEASKF